MMNAKIKNYIKQITIISYFIRKIRFWIIKNSQIQNAKGGFKFIGPKNMITGEFEKEESVFFHEVLNSSDILVNIGANIGYYVCAAIVKGKKVIAFEPDINNYKLLVRNVKLNDVSNHCLTFNFGIGNDWNPLKIYHASTGSSFIKGWANNSSHFFNEVQVIRVDDFSFTNYRHVFFLVDVEGFESYVIAGAFQTINSNLSQTWMIEIMTSDEYGRIMDSDKRQLELVNIFEENDFNVYCLSKNGISSIKYSDLKNCIEKRESTFGHNFIFKKD